MQIGINKHEPIGRVQFVVFEKFTSAYFFQIAHEKSGDFLLIIHIKKFRDGWAEETHTYHAIRGKLCHQLRHKGRTLDLKRKDLLGHLWVSLIIDQSECLLCFLLLHWINSLLHCFPKKNCTALNQSEWRNFFMYITLHLTQTNYNQMQSSITLSSWQPL